MRCYYETAYCDIQFDKAGYQQFLRDQGLSEHDIKHLSICFITDFTCLHFKGSIDLEEGGAFYKRCREYVEEHNKTTGGLYRPHDPPSSEYAAIFLRPAKYLTPARWNHTFLHETRHHIQHCLKLPCCSIVHAGVANEAHSAKNQPWEIDADQFAEKYVNQISFFLPVSRPLRRSDLRNL
jgi:hypothetical protein